MIYSKPVHTTKLTVSVLLQNEDSLVFLKFIVVMDTPTDKLKLIAERKNVTVLTIEEVEEQGKNKKDRQAAIVS